jgi:3-phosphoshikimate 1-carboxyvinyltransferase
MQSLFVSRSRLKSTVEIPSSKSYANRALILAAISSHPVLLENLPDATDVTHLINALKSLGLKIEYTSQGMRFLNSFPACETDSIHIQVGDGGTTARFLAALCLLGSKRYSLELHERLSQRPWGEFLRIAKDLGAHAHLQGNILTIQGPVNFPKELNVDCSQTTQFATAFALVASDKSCEVIPKGMDASESYWEMTKALIKTIPHATSYSVPLDWSSASYPLAFAALNQQLFIPELHLDPFQADACFFHVLKSFDCIQEMASGISVSPIKNKSQSISLDVSQCLDLTPSLAFFLSHIEGHHQLKNVTHLSYKESDRLQEIIQLLSQFDKKVTLEGENLIIYGDPGRIFRPVDLKLPRDHRMVMAGALFLLHHSGGSLYPSEAVEKSFPGFFSMILPP